MGGEAGSVSLEVVLLVPVLVLLTLFVLWAGRGGRAGLTADLAAEEAATAAAVCCEEGEGGADDREAVVEDVLESRPGLEYLCVGGLRPGVENGAAGGPEFVDEAWLEFDPSLGSDARGAGVLGVRFLCETDGAVAPLRGLFPTVMFRGQASEVVLQNPLGPGIGFSMLTVSVDEDATELVFEVKADEPVGEDVVVHFTITNIAGNPVLVHTPPPLSVQINAGDRTAQIRVPLYEDDKLYEGDETLTLTLDRLENGGGAPLPASVASIAPARDTAVGVVSDNDEPPHLFVSTVPDPCEVVEGGTVSLVVRLRDEFDTANAPSATPVTVDVKTSDGTATAGTDYTAVDTANAAPPGTLTFSPGEHTKTVVVSVLDDELSPVGEPTETFHVDLVNASAPVKRDRATCSILDDEVEASVGNVEAPEGGGTLTFTVHLDDVPTADVHIGYSFTQYITGPHATAGPVSPPQSCASPGYPVDYLPLGAPPTPLIISPPDRQADLTVTICDDTVTEPAETFWLEIRVDQGEATVEADKGAVGTILDDDGPVITVGNESGQEPPAGAGTLTFTARLEVGGQAAVLTDAVEVDYEVKAAAGCSDPAHTTRTACQSGGAIWTQPATAGADYRAAAGSALSGTLTFEPPGSCSDLSYSTKSACEGASETWTPSGSCSDPSHSTASACRGAGGTWTLDGAAAQTIDVQILADHLMEVEETFTLTLWDGDAVGARSGYTRPADYDTDAGADGVVIESGAATGTIIDDPPPVLSITLDPAHAAARRAFTGAEGETRAFEITLAGARPGETVTVDYEITDILPWCSVSTLTTRTACEAGGAIWTHSATAGADYRAAAGSALSGTLTFGCTDPAHTTRTACQSGGATWSPPTDAQTVEVDLLHDTIVDEPAETLRLTLSSPVGAVLEGTTATGAVHGLFADGVVFDADPPELEVGDTAAREGQDLVFEVTLANPRDEVVTVDYTVRRGSARPGADFVAPPAGTLTFEPPGSCSDPSHSTRSACVGAGETWTPSGSCSVSSHSTASACRGAGQTWTLDGPAPQTVTVATLTDKLAENPETVILRLDEHSVTPGHVAVGDGVGVGTIINVNPVEVRALDAVAEEGGDLSFQIELLEIRGDGREVRATAAAPIEVEYYISDGTARAGRCDRPNGRSDYDRWSPARRRVTFTPGGSGVHAVEVRTCADLVAEADETLFLNLAVDPDNDAAVLGDARAVGTIRDNSPVLRIGDATADEGDALRFPVRLGIIRGGSFQEAAARAPVTVQAATEDGTATEPADYDETSSRLTFATGVTELHLEVPTHADDIGEDPDETLRALLSSPRGALIDRSAAIGTITDGCVDKDDPTQSPPVLSVPDVRIGEGERFTVNIRFSRPMCDADPDDSADFSFEIQYRAVEHSDPDTPDAAECDQGLWDETGGRDLLCVSGFQGSRFGRRDSSGPGLSVVQHRVYQDGRDEPDETLLLQAKWGANMPARYRSVDWVTGTATIIDGDPPPALTVDDGDAEAGDPIGFTVTLTPASGRTVTVDYATADATADSGSCSVPAHATETGCTGSGATWTPGDYTAATGALTFAPGVTSRTVMVATEPNSADEADETFLLELSDPVHALLGDRAGVGTIRAGGLPVLRIADASAAEGSSPMRFPVTLSEPAAQAVTVDYATVERPAGGTAATAGSCSVSSHSTKGACEGASETWTPGDYTAASGTLTIPPGATEATIDVAVTDDGADEFDETFLVELANPAGASLGDPSAVGTITGERSCARRSDVGADDAPAPTWNSPRTGEGDGAMTFSFTLDVPWCLEMPIWVLSPTARGTATPGEDFIALGVLTQLQLASLQDRASFDVELIDDREIENDEEIVLELAPLLAPVARWYPTGTIVDNDSGTVSVLDASAGEGDELGFTVRLNHPAVGDATVDWATSDLGLCSDRAHTTRAACEAGSETWTPSPTAATAGRDYTAASGTATIAAGRLATTVRVRALQDRLDELDEQFTLTLSNPAIAGGPDLSLARPEALGTITDDEDPPTARVSDAEGEEGEALEFTVTLSEASGRQVSIAYATAGGTATAGSDFDAATGSVVFAAGQTAATVTVPTLADDVVEAHERFQVLLSAPDGALLGDAVGIGTIVDASARRLRVSDATAGEGGVLSFEVSFEQQSPSARTVTVDYATADGTATAGADYTAAAGTARIAAGQTAATVAVSALQDRLDEPAEQFRLVLSDPTGATLAVAEAVGSIADDDPLPRLRIDDPEATENDDDSVTFTVTLSEASGRDVTVEYATADSSPAAGWAAAGADYTAATGTLAIEAGDTEATIDVALLDDSDAEDPETLRLQLSDPANALLGDAVGVATILDDDALPQIVVDDAAGVLESSGASATFRVHLSRSAAADVTVEYATADGTAEAGADYTADTGTLTIAAGDTEATIDVALLDDALTEQTETLQLLLSNPSSNAVLGDDRAVATIYDDESLPPLAVRDAAAAEGAVASFELRLDRPSARSVTVRYSAVADPTAGATAAVPAQDFTAVTGTATIAARATGATVSVPLLDDALDEAAETFWLRLAGPAGATLRDGTATGTILDNDPPARLRVGDAGAEEGETLAFTVVLEPVSGLPVTVPYTTVARAGAAAATAGTDFTPASGTLSLPPGATTADIAVPTIEDATDEPDETLLVQLGQPANAVVDDGAAVGAIRDDDGLPRIFISGTELTEDDSPATFAVTLSHPGSRPVTVDYAVVDGTATRPDDFDYFEQSRTLVIPATLTRGEISVYIVDDALDEGTEHFQVVLSNPRNAVIAEGDGTATGTILDNERVLVGIADATADEGDGTIDFAVTLSGARTEATTVRYTTFDGTATQPDDYSAATGTLTIPPGATEATVEIALTDDTFVEDPAVESFLVRLTSPDGAELGDAEAAGLIVDDDDLPILRLSDLPDVREDVGTVTAEVRLEPVSDRRVTVQYAAAVERFSGGRGCATITPASGTLVFEPGDNAETFDIEIVPDPARCPGSVVTVVVEIGRAVNAATAGGWNGTIPNSTLRGVPVDKSRFRVFDAQVDPWMTIYSGDASRGPIKLDAVGEGAGSAAFRVELAWPADEDATIAWRTHNRWRHDAVNRATPGADYTHMAATVTIPAGQTVADIAVPLIDDAQAESTERFGVCDAGYTYPDGRGGTRAPRSINRYRPGHVCAWMSIQDDDSPPSIRVSGARVAETAGTVVVLVEMDRVSSQEVTVDYATADGTATAGADYTSTAGTVTFPAGLSGLCRRDNEHTAQEAELGIVCLAVVEVPILSDDADEADETFDVVLQNPSGASLAPGEGRATVTIVDPGGGPPVITFADSRGLEAGGWELPLEATLSSPIRDSASPTSCGWSVACFKWTPVFAPWLGDEAADLGDLDSARFGGVVGFSPGWRGGRITTFADIIVNDNIPEHDERFMAVFHDPDNLVLGTDHIWVTIVDDDLPEVSVADATVSEDGGAVVFELRLHAPGVRTGSIDYTTVVRGSAGEAAAVPGQDFTPVSGTATFAPGQSTAEVSVPVIDDIIDEVDKTLLLSLSNPRLVVVTDATALGTITDDDDGWTIDDRSVSEGAGQMAFTVTRDHTAAAAVTVDYTVTGASAAGGAACGGGIDYITPAGSVTLAPAQTTATITVTICDDAVTEARETLLVELTGVPGRKLTGTGTIVDND